VARRSPLLAVLGLLLATLVACGDDAPSEGSGSGTATTTTTSSPASTSTSGATSSSTTGAPSSSTTASSTPATATTSAPSASLPADDRPRTPPVDATDDLAGLAPQADFEAFAAEVVAALEARFPAEGPAHATDAAWAAGAERGVVLFRADGFADDSLAGYEYQVEAVGSGGTWTVASATRQAICRRGLAGEYCL